MRRPARARVRRLVAAVAVGLCSTAAVAHADGPSPLQTVVTAPPPATTTPQEDHAAAASVVRPADSPRAYDDLGTLLLQVPGVIVARTGSTTAYSTLTLRGSNPDQVLIYLDGVPLNIAQGGGVDVSTLPLGDVDRVEVYRGSTPLAFAESALGGVISIVTRTPGSPRVEARAGVGSYGTLFGDATAGGRVGRLRLYLGVHGYSSRGDYPYTLNNTSANPATAMAAIRSNNDAKEGNGVLRAALTLAGRRTLSLGLVGFARGEGLPGPTNHITTLARFDSIRSLGYLRYESRDDLGPGGRLSVETFASLEHDRVSDPAGEVLNLGPMTTHESTLAEGLTANGSRPFGEWGRAAVVLEGRHESYDMENETTPALSGVPARRLVGVAGGELGVRVRPIDLELIPSARVELMNDVVTGLNPNTARPIPAGPAVVRTLPVYRLGLVHPLGEAASLKANAGHYERAPSFLELYGNGNDRLLGNPTLRPESGTNADLALWIDRAGPRVAASSRTTLFGALADDLIYWVTSSNGPARAENLSRARVYGLEQELRLAFGRHLRLVGQGTITVAEDESDVVASRGKQIPHHPRYSAYGRPEIADIALPAGLQLAAFADAALFAGSYDDPADIRRVPTQVVVGAGVSLLWPRAGLRATASALNLTDLQTWDISYWPLPGRTIFLALAYDSAVGDEPGRAPLSIAGNP